LQWAAPTVTRPTRPRKRPGPLDTFGPRVKNRGRHQASPGCDGRPESGYCRQLGVVGRVQGASQQGHGPDLGRREEGANQGGLSAEKGIDGGGRRSASQSGGRRRGWSGRGGIPWLREARCGLEGGPGMVGGVQHWGGSCGGRDSASASALGG
jgi:hypothetical protein